MNTFLQNKRIQSLLWFILFIFIWEISSRMGVVNAYILPPFSKVATNLARELILGKLGIQALSSMWLILGGFFISFVMAVAITLLSSWLNPVKNMFVTLCVIFNPLPSVAVIPLIIMWFGVSTLSMLVIIIHGVLWALVQHMIDGLNSIPEIYWEWGKNINLSPWHMFTDILVFAIMPELLAGVRIGWGRAWRALISGEMLFGMVGASGGLGQYIYINRAYANLTNVMSGIVVIIIIGILVETLLFGQIEKHTIQKWGMTNE